jgi:hypothetical protein
MVHYNTQFDISFPSDAPSLPQPLQGISQSVGNASTAALFEAYKRRITPEYGEVPGY